MANEMLVRAWKDEEYRESLGDAERALLPENPAGSLELTDAELDRVAGGGPTGGGGTFCFLTVFLCGGSFVCQQFSVCGNFGGNNFLCGGSFVCQVFSVCGKFGGNNIG